MEKWFVTMKKADFNGIAEKYQISPIIARLMRNRDVIGDEAIDFYLNGTVEDLYDGLLMKDMDRAVDILKEKIEEGKKIRVIGDYDIDGVNATYILQQGLAGLGADVDTDIPDRIKDGYGLNQMLIDRALEDDVDTIITCDNGIAAMNEIAYGKEQGMTIVVTDHHEVPYLEENGEKKYLLPPADAVVDPHRADCEYPFKGLCGAAVAYKLVEVLYRVSGKSEQEVEHLQESLMENVAIATIGDVMDLVGENRVFVKKGLELLKTTKNEGLHALMQCTGVDTANLNTYHIGFVLGPCINAGGRLDTAKRALELLNASNRREAVTLAADLKEKKKQGITGNSLKGKNIALIFEKPSTRTRCAFTVGACDEGGIPTYLSEHDIQLGHKESIQDTARVLGRMFDGIEFRGFKHEHVEALAKYSGVPVWNGLTDEYHPTQILADLLTMKEHFGYVKGLKFVYLGDGRNNMANSLMIGCSKVGVDFVIIAPKKLWPGEELVTLCEGYAKEAGSSVCVTDSIDAVEGADVLYTDVWCSMGEEDKAAERIALLSPYQINQELMDKTGKEGTIFMHCLPAVKGKEVTEDVFEGKASVVFDEAENRLHTIKAVMVATLGE